MNAGTRGELETIYHYRPAREWPSRHPSDMYSGLCYWTAGKGEHGHLFPKIYFNRVLFTDGNFYAIPIEKSERP